MRAWRVELRVYVVFAAATHGMRIPSELRRRNVVKVATVYVVGWGVIRQRTSCSPPDTAEGTVTLVVALVIAGFPISLMLAWAFELTPSGIARENREAVSADSELTAVDRRIEPAPVPISVRKPLEAREQRSSPFSVRGYEPGHDHEYFADGLAENCWTRWHGGGLCVPSRTSCFALRARTWTLRWWLSVAGLARARRQRPQAGRAHPRCRKLVETAATQLW
jgi:hypothetical protein